jgi:dTDP-4-amino-4,6-dideoxygalactose transaminase
MGIATGIHYPIPIHLQPAYEELGYTRGAFPITEEYTEKILSLPMYPGITPEAIKHTAEVIIRYQEKESAKVMTA